MIEFLNAETHTPVLLVRDVWIWVNTVFILTSLRTEIARSVRGPNLKMNKKKRGQENSSRPGWPRRAPFQLRGLKREGCRPHISQTLKRGLKPRKTLWKWRNGSDRKDSTGNHSDSHLARCYDIALHSEDQQEGSNELLQSAQSAQGNWFGKKTIPDAVSIYLAWA